MRVVDRRDWAATNIAGLREVITPLVTRLSGDKQPGAISDAIGSRLTGVQAGTVLAYLSGRVLGQYEVFGREEKLTQAVTLFALLEMHKRGEATWEQDGVFGQITISGAST